METKKLSIEIDKNNVVTIKTNGLNSMRDYYEILSQLQYYIHYVKER